MGTQKRCQGKVTLIGKEFTRLVAFGCSNTYGHGLPDCQSHDLGYGTRPSKYAWPARLAKLLGIKSVDNRSVPGSSNKQIAKAILDYPLNDKDLVVVGWSFVERDCLFTDLKTDFDFLPKQEVINLGVSQRDKLNTIWQKNFFNYSDRFIETGMFSTLGSKYAHVHAAGYLGFFCCLVDIDGYSKFAENFDPVQDIAYFEILNNHGRAKDHFHPSVESHYEIAKKLWEILRLQQNEV